MVVPWLNWRPILFWSVILALLLTSAILGLGLPGTPDDFSAWELVTTIFQVLGALAALAAILFAWSDRIARERPQLHFRLGVLRLGAAPIKQDHILVNVGLGPAMAVSLSFDFYISEVTTQPKPGSEGTIAVVKDHDFGTDLLGVSEGIGDQLFGFSFVLAMQYASVSDVPLSHFGFSFFMPVSVSYTDRAGRLRYEDKFELSGQVEALDAPSAGEPVSHPYARFLLVFTSVKRN